MWNAIVLVTKASIRLELKSKVVFFTTLLVPLSYPVIFFLQIIFSYKVNPHPFYNLNMNQYFVCLYATQSMFWLSYDKSARTLMDDVLYSNLDTILLRPINLFFFKYFRRFDIYAGIMVALNLILLIGWMLYIHTPFLIIIKMFVFVIIASLLILNLKCWIYGLIFFYRDAKQLRRFHYALEDMTYNKPADIYPSMIKFVLTFILPYIIIQAFSYEVIRLQDSYLFWATAILWCAVAMLVNRWIWSMGLKAYESSG